MKDNKEYLKDIYNKYEQEKKNSDVFYINKIQKKSSILSKVASVLLIVAVASTGTFAGVQVYKGISMNPQYGFDSFASGDISNIESIVDTNKLWCGTFQLVWNDLMDEIVGGPVEFDNYESPLAKELNKQKFTADMISPDSYYKFFGQTSRELKKIMEDSIREKCGETSNVLEDVDWDNPNAKYVLYCMLKKEFKFLTPFSELDKESFGDSLSKVRYFGVVDGSDNKMYNNIEVLWYNSNVDFAVKLLTKENEEIILYRTDDNKSFEELYNDILRKNKEYTKNKKFTENDTLKVPFITVNEKMNYVELCNQDIKGTKMYIDKAIQTIEFSLDNNGGKLISEATISLQEKAEPIEKRKFEFKDNFVMFIKEKDKDNPYFAMYVTDDQMLVK